MLRLAAAVLLTFAAAMPAEARERLAATITRTAFGIPHIQARDWRGIGYGVGYAYAQDNLCQAAEEFATVAGERSLHWGPEAKAVLGFAPIDNLSSDLFFRSVIDMPALRAGAKRLGAEAVALSAGYVAGYNRRLREIGPGGVPAACRGKAWVRPITTDDMLRVAEKQVLLAGSLAMAEGIARAAPPSPQGAVLVPPAHARPEVGFGSNGFAFGGEVTADGKGLLIGNPHFPWEGPNRFWQMHLTIPGRLDVAGVGLAGMPFPAIGFNRDVAWTHTVTAAEHFTLFELSLDPADPTAYLVDGQREVMRRLKVSVPMPAGRPAVERTLYATRHGPIVLLPGGLGWSKQRAYSLRDANSGNQRALPTWIGIARARSVAEIRQAVERSLGIPWVNTIAADRDGGALLADVTAVPNVSADLARRCATPRSPAVAGVILLDGSRAECDWKGALLPATDQAVFARRDYVANMNDSYWLTNPRATPPMLSPILGPHGTERSLRTRIGFQEVEQRLAGGGKVDADWAKAMLLSNRSLAGDMALDRVLGLCRGKPEVAAACAALGGWDRRYDLDSRGAHLFTAFWRQARNIPGLWAVPFAASDPLHTPRELVTEGEVGAKLLAALAGAAEQVGKAGLPLDARWGDVQFAVRGSERIPVHGGEAFAGILNYQSSVPVAGGLVPRHGSSFIQVVRFDDKGPIADTTLSYSQATDPASPHFADGTREYSGKRWHRFPFSAAEIAGAGGKVERIAE